MMMMMLLLMMMMTTTTTTTTMTMTTTTTTTTTMMMMMMMTTTTMMMMIMMTTMTMTTIRNITGLKVKQVRTWPTVSQVGGLDQRMFRSSSSNQNYKLLESSIFNHRSPEFFNKRKKIKKEREKRKIKEFESVQKMAMEKSPVRDENTKLRSRLNRSPQATEGHRVRLAIHRGRFKRSPRCRRDCSSDAFPSVWNGFLSISRLLSAVGKIPEMDWPESRKPDSRRKRLNSASPFSAVCARSSPISAGATPALSLD